MSLIVKLLLLGMLVFGAYKSVQNLKRAYGLHKEVTRRVSAMVAAA